MPPPPPQLEDTRKFRMPWESEEGLYLPCFE